jgi:hypothetical protein
MLKTSDSKDNRAVSLKVESKQVVIDSWDESYHNGSSYNDTTEVSDFPNTKEFNDSLVQVFYDLCLEIYTKEDAKRKEEEARRLRSG